MADAIVSASGSPEVTPMTRKGSLVRSRTPSETAEAHAIMAGYAEKIEQWYEFVATPRPVSKNSALDVADALSDPFPSSHTVSYSILTAVDHLHALRALLVDAKAQHIFAPYTLVRAAIENAATALWIMSDPNPRAIAVRSLKMEHANHRDVARAYETVGAEPLTVRFQLFDDVIAKNNMKKDGIKANPKGHLKILEEVSKTHDLGILPALMWQLCSAAAHGRNWAIQILTMMEAEDDGIAKTISGKLTSDENAIANALQVVGPLIDRTMTMQLSRCSATGSTGESFIKPVPKLLLPKPGLIFPK